LPSLIRCHPFADDSLNHRLKFGVHYTPPSAGRHWYVTSSTKFLTQIGLRPSSRPRWRPANRGIQDKLRLTEAARLLSENSGAAILEIAYSVGYANASCFNKLFKEEYGCTPKLFRSISAQQSVPALDFPAKPAAHSPP
ncbi:helix-turn-helix domain-containing protein, partial [Massilia orientalis]